MEIIDFYASDNKDYWLSEIQKSDWSAGKYLYELLLGQKLKDIGGEDSRIYRTDVVTMDYSDVLGASVNGTIDRPIGSTHPRHPEMIYPINYGYVDGVFAGDGAEQDVYVFGAEQPINTFSGKIVGVYHRLNDNEDKWIVSLSGEPICAEDILRAISFQEQYFMGELYV